MSAEDERAARAAILSRFEGTPQDDALVERMRAEMAAITQRETARFNALMERSSQEIEALVAHRNLLRAEVERWIAMHREAKDEVFRLRATIMGMAGRADDLFRSGCEAVEESEKRL